MSRKAVSFFIQNINFSNPWILPPTTATTLFPQQTTGSLWLGMALVCPVFPKHQNEIRNGK